MALGRKTGGRTKGTPNKTTASVKEALGAAFDGVGGVSALQTWAEANPTEFYKLWVKLLPQQVDLDANLRAEVKRIEHVVVRPSEPNG